MIERTLQPKPKDSPHQKTPPGRVQLYIKQRRPPPLKPRRLPCKPAKQPSEPKVPLRPRNPPPVPYRLYSIAEREEESSGKHFVSRRKMSEQQQQIKDPASGKSSGTQMDHYGSMPDMSSKQNSEKDIGPKETESNDLVLANQELSFLGTEPLYTSSPLPKEEGTFDFNIEAGSVQNEQNQSTTMYQTALETDSEIHVQFKREWNLDGPESSVDSVASDVDNEIESKDEQGKETEDKEKQTKATEDEVKLAPANQEVDIIPEKANSVQKSSVNVPQDMAAKSSQRMLTEKQDQLKVVDSIGTFVRPSELLHKKLKPSNAEKSRVLAEDSSASMENSGSPTNKGPTTKVVKYDEQAFKDAVASSLKEHDPFDVEEKKDEDGEKEGKEETKATLHRSSSEPNDLHQKVVTEETPRAKSDDVIGYGSHHDFTSVVDFLEVLKDKEKEEKLASDVVEKKHSFNSNDGSSPRGKYIPAIPSPLTYSSSSEVEEDTVEVKGSKNQVQRSIDESETKGDNLRSVSSEEQDEVKMVEYIDKEITFGSPLKEQDSATKKTPGYGEFDYTSPSKLEKVETRERQETNGKSQSYGNLEYTTPSKLLQKVETREKQERSKKSPGYGEMDYTTPSKLLEKIENRERNEKSEKLPGYGTLDYASPSKLLEKVETRKSNGKSPGYGQLDYTTPSKLFEKVESRQKQEAKVKSPGYGEMDYTTPSKLLERVESRERRETKERSPGYGEMDYTTPSKLLERVESRERRETKEKSPGYGEMDYTTPSKLLERVESRERHETKEKSPGYGEMDYTTPSKLLERVESRERRETKERSPGYGEMDYTTPSKLLERVESRERRETKEKSPGYGEMAYTTPSKLLERVESRERHETKEKSPGYGEMDYTTPSKLLERVARRERRETKEKSPGYGEMDYATPSKLLERVESRERRETKEKSPGYGEMAYTTPSKLLEKVETRKINEKPPKCPGYGYLDYTTPSKLLERVETIKHGKLSEESPGYGTLNYTTPSKLLEKVLSRERKGPIPGFSGYGQIEYTTPSKLLKRYEARKITEKQATSPGYGQFDYSTPSKLLEKVEMREGRKEEDGLQGYGKFDYTTPSRLLEKVEMEKLEREKSQGYGRFDYTTPSKLLKKVEFRERNEKMGASPGYGVIDYTTPSELLRKVEARERNTLQNGVQSSGIINQTSQQRDHDGSPRSDTAVQQYLLRPFGDFSTGINVQRQESAQKQGNKKLAERPKKAGEKGSGGLGIADGALEKTSSEDGEQILALHRIPSAPVNVADAEEEKGKNLHRKGSIELYTAPSKLLQMVEKREQRQRKDKFTGYGTMEYTTPSQLHGLYEDRKDEQRKTSPSYAERLLENKSSQMHSRPSDLFEKIEKREQREFNKKSIDDSKDDILQSTPSNLLGKVEKREFRQKKRNTPDDSEDLILHDIPSGLLGKVEKILQRVKMKQEAGPSSQSIDRDTRSEDRLYPTVSKLLDKVLKREQIEKANEEKMEKHERDHASVKPMTDAIRQDSSIGPSGSSQHGFVTNTAGSSSPTISQVFDMIRNGSFSHSAAVDKKGSVPECQSPTISQVFDLVRHGMFGRQSAEGTREQGQSGAQRLEVSRNQMECDSTVESEKSSAQKGSNTYQRNYSSSWKASKEDSRLRSDSVNRKRSIPVGYIQSDITAYYTNNSDEMLVPSRGNQSEPEFFGMTYDWDSSKLSLVPSENAPGAYEIRSSNQQHGSSSSSNDSDTRQDYGISNPSFQDFSPESSSYSVSHEERVVHNTMENKNRSDQTLDEQASMNQLFWSLYGQDPALAERVITESDVPLKSVLSSLIDLCTTSPENRERSVEEQDRSPHKKRALPHSPTSTSPGTRSFFMEKEVLESQNRKLQMEISTLTTENKLYKEKYNRATAKISDLEEELYETKTELESLQMSTSQEVSDIQRKSRSDAARDIDQLQSKMTTLIQENENLKSEIFQLESKLQAAGTIVDMARQNSDKNNTVEAYKMEVTTLKEEVTRLKSLLEQSEKHLREEENRLTESNQQVIKLTELKNLLQHQMDMSGGGNTVVDKQIKSLEKRLKITEERLHHERSDRANNLSAVEDKLLTENARLQATEKELSRQLQREKDKNCNLEQKIKDVRNENEKLRLQIPFDETMLSSEKYDIPYSGHSSQRQELTKNHDFKHICAQLENQTGVTSEKEMICHLWSTREQSYSQIQKLELMLQDLNLGDNDVVEGLKNLRDLKYQYELKTKQADEKVEDAKSERFTFEATYKDQLAQLVKERHEAFAKLKTAEDLLEATRSENEILRHNLPALSAGTMQLQGKDSEKESLNIKVQNLESKVQALSRSNQVMEGEIKTLKIQMEAREKTLKDVESELEIANSKLSLDKDDDRKHLKVEKLNAQIQSLQAEMSLMTDKYNRILVDYRSLENELDTCRQELSRYRHKETSDNKGTYSIQEELADKTQQINKMAEEMDRLDNELQQSRQDLYQEQLQFTDVEGQMETLQQQFEERGRIIDAISESEGEQMSQYTVLKSTLDSLHADIMDKEGKIRILTVDLSRERDKLEQRERKLAVYEGRTDQVTPPSVAEVEHERDQLKTELKEAYTSLKAKEEELLEMEAELKQLQNEGVNQKAEILQLSSEKGELEQHLEEIAEEHDALIQEKSGTEEDIVKLENKLQELVETLESEAKRQFGEFDSSSESNEEAETLRALLKAKNKEIEMFQLKTSHQQMDLEFLQRRIELLHNDNQSNREDIARMTNQLIIKMKEGVESRQLNEFLSGERIRLQGEINKLGQDLQSTTTLQTVKQTEAERDQASRQSSLVAALEKDLEAAKKSLQELEYENVQLRYKADSLQDDQRKLSTLNSSLENKIEAERKLYEERQQEVMSLNHKLDLLQREHDHVLNNLNTEKQLKDKLNNDYQIYSTQNENLRQEIRDIQGELDHCQKQLTTNQDALKLAKQDKGVMYHEYENMVKRLSEKDQRIIELETKLDVAKAEMEKELHIQKHAHEMEKTSTERELDIRKEQVTSLSAEVKHKDTELSTFGRSLHELEEVKRQKNKLEEDLHVSQATVNDLRVLLENHKKEIKSLQQSLTKYQEATAKTQLEKAGLEDKLHRLEESTSAQIHDMNKTITELQGASDGEKLYLKDNLTQTQSQLQSLESSLSSAVQARDKLHVENRLLQRTVEETRDQLQEETTARKVAGQKADTLESQLHESRKERFLTEEKHNKAQEAISRLERDLKAEKDKLRIWIEKSQEYEASAYSHQCTVKTKQEQIDVLQSEVNKLKQILESQKLTMNSRMKKNTQEMTQQIELIDLDRNKLSQQNKQLFTDLEQSRELVQTKNRENLKLQEDMLQLQEQVHELTFKYKTSEESKKAEAELQEKLRSKLKEQEEELRRLKSFLSKKAEESGEADKSVWHEMNKMIHDMSKQMSIHLESQKVSDNKEREFKIVHQYKKQIHDLNTELQTERALHKITATSLQSLEEDCARLRQQCLAMRRRNNSASDKKYKSRMEAINEIIARSQTQAQAMLSSGNYLDDSLKSLRSPRTVTFDASPDNSICSDMSFNSTIEINHESTPRKPTSSSTPKS